MSKIDTKIHDHMRTELIKGLERLGEAKQRLFKRMYSPHNLNKPIPEVVQELPADKLTWALRQVRDTQ